jgi:membrane protease YdiL (CAAX protease family)
LEQFSWELPINLFTGISEEFVFRGMIFIGLWKFLGRWKALLISSFYFAIWHYDVTQDLLGLTAIFFAGCFFSLAFSSGASLLTLSIFHFVYDQIHFGLIWTRNESIAYDVSITLAHCLLAILVSLMHPALKLDKLTGSLTE